MSTFNEESIAPDTVGLVQNARSLVSPSRFAGRKESIGTLLYLLQLQHPDKVFLLYPNPDGNLEQYTCRQIFQQAVYYASVLKEYYKIAPGDIVVTVLNSSTHTVFLYFALWLIGAAVSPVNREEEDNRISYILQNTNAVCCITLPELAERTAPLCPEQCKLLTIGASDVPDSDNLFTLIPTLSIHHSEISLDQTQRALIVYTSGTTGPPKGVELDQRNLVIDALSIADWHHFTQSDRALNVLPIHHVNGIVVTLLTPLVSAGSVVLSPRFSAAHFWRHAADYQCTWSSVVPTILAFLSQRADNLAEYALQGFRHIVCGAGPLTVEVARKFEDTFGIRIIHGYGLSETTCYSCFLPASLPEQEHNTWMRTHGFPSIGCALPVNEMAVFSTEGIAMPPGERGEIVIRGENVMKGYYRRADTNREAFAHGWFHSGDEGFYLENDEGKRFFFITGRLKELIIRGGVNYSPFDIDEVLNAIPGVRTALAVGFENEFYGEEIGAYVVLQENTLLTEQDILTQCRKRLSFARSPKVVLFGTDIPVTSTGKYQRNKLKPYFSNWKNTQFKASGAPSA